MPTETFMVRVPFGLGGYGKKDIGGCGEDGNGEDGPDSGECRLDGLPLEVMLHLEVEFGVELVLVDIRNVALLCGFAVLEEVEHLSIAPFGQAQPVRIGPPRLIHWISQSPPWRRLCR